MNAKNTIIIGLAALTAIAGTATVAQAARETSLGVVNVSGTVPNPGGGSVITINLVNGAGTNVGTTSYTTVAGNSEDRVANRLRSNFTGAGFRAKRLDDKSDGTEVIEFFRKRNGGQPATISVTNGEGSITVTQKATSALASANFDNDSIDLSFGFAELLIFSKGFLKSLLDIVSVSFGDNIFTNNFQILDDSTMAVQISWDPSLVSLGPEAVFIDGFDLGDAENPFNPVTLWVVDDFTFTPAPGPMALAGLAGLVALRRRRIR